MDYMVRGLSHIGIYTDDLEKAATFYIEHFRFRMLYKKELPGFSCWFVENHGLVLEFVGKGRAEGAGGAIYHIAIEVCGIEALVECLKKKDVIPADALIGQNRDFFPSGIKNIFFTGPSGERIELFELAS